MSRILIFAPNGGASLSSGGGTNTLLKQAKALSAGGSEVVLAGFHAWTLPELSARNGLNLPPLRIESATHGNSAAKVFEWLPFKASPYSVLLHPGFATWARNVVRTVRPEIVWFHDDIPRCLLPELRGRSVNLYIHFPFGARTPAISPPLSVTTSFGERWNDWAISHSRAIADLGAVELSHVHVNSTITQNVVRKAWGLRSEVVWPYVSPGPRSSYSAETVLAIGTMAKGKNYTALLQGWHEASSDGVLPASAKLVIAGYSRDARYRAQLIRTVKELGLQETVKISSNLSRSALETWLSSATVIAHAAIFEPFGLSVLEGMSRGLIPVVYKSEWAGDWVDIIERGRWGIGFDSSITFADCVARAFAERERLSIDAIARAGYFSEERFVLKYQEEY